MSVRLKDELKDFFFKLPFLEWYNSHVLRKLLLTISFFFFFILQFSIFNSVLAIYDPLSVPNNRFGIHILETSETGKASQFVNSSGGDWGYITIPIRSNERDIEKWTQFMNDCRTLHLIPILRIATFPKNNHWMAPNEWDLIDFSNFLNELPWPTKNRYIIIYNEPNHQGEWGGFVNPEEYARILDRAIDIFHRKNPDFYVISAGLDSSAPNGPNSMDEFQYLRQMENRFPGIFRRIDGFSSHSYGNPAFSFPPNLYSRFNIANFQFEQNFLRSVGVENINLFITEAGWAVNLIGDDLAAKYYLHAFQNVWSKPNIVAVTPFVLTADSGPFSDFSFTQGDFKPFVKEIRQIPKISGRPYISIEESLTPNNQIIKFGRSSNRADSLKFFGLIQQLLSIINL